MVLFRSVDLTFKRMGILMKIYIARQPIYKSDKSLFGYELLYRNSDKNYFSSVDEEKATRELTYNVLTEFDFNSLTNEKYAFINFTKDSLMSELPLFFNPNNIIIEILETVTLDESLRERISFLKGKGYVLALDDFIDDGTYDEIIPYIDIIKVEYSLLNQQLRTSIATKYKNTKKLIAERVETKEEYESAINDGYSFFQGYYFSKPIMMSKSSISIATSTYIRLWREISKEDTDFNILADIIKLDASLSYKLLSLMNTPLYFRGGRINSIKQGLVRLGTNQAKRWIMLLFLCDISNTKNDEFAKMSLIRATFMEKLIVKLGHKNMSDDTYMVGLLSIVGNVLEQDMLTILDTLELSDNIKMALINEDGIAYELLECIKKYELRNWQKVDEFGQRYNLDKDMISSIYLESLKYADDMFRVSLNELVKRL